MPASRGTAGAIQGPSPLPHLYPTDSTSQAALSVRTRGSALRVGSDGAWSIRGPSMENVDSLFT